MTISLLALHMSIIHHRDLSCVLVALTWLWYLVQHVQMALPWYMVQHVQMALPWYMVQHVQMALPWYMVQHVQMALPWYMVQHVQMALPWYMVQHVLMALPWYMVQHVRWPFPDIWFNMCWWPFPDIYGSTCVDGPSLIYGSTCADGPSLIYGLTCADGLYLALRSCWMSDDEIFCSWSKSHRSQNTNILCTETSGRPRETSYIHHTCRPDSQGQLIIIGKHPSKDNIMYIKLEIYYYRQMPSHNAPHT